MFIPGQVQRNMVEAGLTYLVVNFFHYIFVKEFRKFFFSHFDSGNGAMVPRQSGFPSTAYVVEREVFMRYDDELLAQAA